MKSVVYLFLLILISFALLNGATGVAQADSPTAWPTYRLRGANIVPGTRESDLDDLKKWNANCVRIQDLTLISNSAPYAVNESRLDAIYKMIDLSLDLGFYVIFSPGVSNDDQDAFFSNADFQEAFKRMWRRISFRYKNDRRGIAYDLLNEPHDTLASQRWNGYAIDLTHAIRDIDKSHTIVVEPAEWSWPAGFKGFKPTGDKNTVYSFHFYGPMDFTHQRGFDAQGKFTGHLKASEKQRQSRKYPGKIQGELWNKKLIEQYLSEAFKFRDRNHTRIFCGEFGVARWAIGAYQYMKDMLDVLEEHHADWTYYSFREWQAMDIEMSPDAVNEKTDRGPTAMTRLVQSYFKKNSSTK